MSNNQTGNHAMPYLPTSLEFINRPNPVEPHAVPEKHPLNGAPRHEKTSKEEFLRLLLDKDVERPAKRRKSGEPKLLDLPKLPAVRNGTKRLRIPPTLSGLHQPPPDAGLLPSMSVKQPLGLSDKSMTEQHEATEDKRPAEVESAAVSKSADISITQPKGSASKRKHNKWSAEETAGLILGVAKFGIGQWTKILKCPDYHFEGRTALDLKDRFRVCCPDEYKTDKKAKAAQDSNDDNINALDDASNVPADKGRRRKKKTDVLSSSQLHELGIDKPFEQSKRRRRTGYSRKEDEALLRGFQKHGNTWAAIRQDEESLKDRTATDLRDRFRTRYPDEYAKAGLAPRHEQFPKAAKQSEQGDENGYKDATAVNEHAATTVPKPTEKPLEKESKVANQAPPKKPPPLSLFQNDDVFWGAPFEPDDADSEPITLDRGILDWAYELTRPHGSNENTSKSGGIDPLATLNLPRPTAANSGGVSGNTGLLNTQTAVGSSSTNALPSLAAITAGSWHGGAEGVDEQLELPSLLGDFGGLESDGRTGGHFMSMEELLS